MIIVWALSWWYGAGWKAYSAAISGRIRQTLDYFSISLLLKTLFVPFKQISASKVSGPIGVKWRAFVDRLVSRVIGAVVRTAVIVIGIIWIGVQMLYGAAALAVWPLIPLLPIFGFIAAIAGWAPQWK